MIARDLILRYAKGSSVTDSAEALARRASGHEGDFSMFRPKAASQGI
jgi:hypothetical protein